jgi:hypothetical protein
VTGDDVLALREAGDSRWTTGGSVNRLGERAAVGECLYRRAGHGRSAGAAPTSSSPAAPPIRRWCSGRSCMNSAGRWTTGSGSAGHAGRPSAGMRGPDHRRLFRRSRLQGRSRTGAPGLSDRRGGRGRHRRRHQGGGQRRPGHAPPPARSSCSTKSTIRRYLTSRMWLPISRRCGRGGRPGSRVHVTGATGRPRPATLKVSSAMSTAISARARCPMPVDDGEPVRPDRRQCAAW